MYGTLNTIRANYQRIDQDLDDVTNQRDARDAQIVQLQQDVNYFRQQNNALQNHVGHAATKPDKVNIGITKNFRVQNLVICNVIIIHRFIMSHLLSDI